MPDPRPPLEDRLADWFTAETRRAEQDLRAGARPRATRRGAERRRLTVAALAVVAAVAVGTAGIRLATGPSGVASVPSESPMAAPSSDAPSTPRPAASSGLTLGPDGLPATVDGESVGRLDGLRAALANEDSAVVAGWVDQPLYLCTSPEWPLLPTCTGRRLSAEPPTSRSGGPSVDLVVGDADVPFGPVALRVHTRDAAAETCPPGVRARCSAAIVVDEVLWRDDAAPVIRGLGPDGIPTDINGESVLRPAELERAVASRPGPWLLGGWHSADSHRGCGRLGERHPLLDDCSPEKIRNAPGEPGVTLLDARDLPDGPLVVRVHTADTRSESCPAESRAACEAAVVVEEVVWSRDAAVVPAPLDEIEVAGAIAQAVDPERLTFALAPSPPGKDQCDPGWPPVLWAGNDPAGPVGLVAVYASIEEADAVEGRLGSAGWMGLGCNVTFDSLVTWRWERVENAIVQFNLTLPDGTPEQLELAERVRANLETAAAAAP